MASTVHKGLTQDSVLEAAERLVDQDGWRAVTMTALAEAVGVRVPSLYSHVDNADAVRAAVQVRAHAELARRLQRAAMGTAGADAFRALAEVFASFAREHGGLYELAMTEPFDPDAVATASEPAGAALTAVIASFGGATPSPDLVMTCVATLHGVIALERAGLFGSQVDVDSAYQRAVEMVVDLLQRRGREG